MTTTIAKTLQPEQVVVAVNPGSMLGSKMVQEGFGVSGGDLNIGADIIRRAALSDEFVGMSGRYFDNDSGRFAEPHSDALNAVNRQNVVQQIEQVCQRFLQEN